MSNDLTVFAFENNEIRTITDEHGDPWFVLRDVLDALKSTTTTTAALESIKQGLGDGYAQDIPIPDSLGRNQPTVIVSEPATTYLVARSNTEQGRSLNRFLHIEVLPAIRKTGAFQPKPLTAAEHLRLTADMLERQAALEARVEAQDRQLKQIETASDHFTVLGWHRWAKLGGSLPLADAASMGKVATKYCKEHDIAMGDVPDQRFGRVRTYPKWVLDNLFCGPAA